MRVKLVVLASDALTSDCSNCLPVDNYYDWDGWNDPEHPINSRWGHAVKYHLGFKWYWLNSAQTNDTQITIETVDHVVFADIAASSSH